MVAVRIGQAQVLVELYINVPGWGVAYSGEAVGWTVRPDCWTIFFRTSGKIN